MEKYLESLQKFNFDEFLWFLLFVLSRDFGPSEWGKTQYSRTIGKVCKSICSVLENIGNRVRSAGICYACIVVYVEQESGYVCLPERL